jgi:hypothetical protein
LKLNQVRDELLAAKERSEQLMQEMTQQSEIWQVTCQQTSIHENQILILSTTPTGTIQGKETAVYDCHKRKGGTAAANPEPGETNWTDRNRKPSPTEKGRRRCQSLQSKKPLRHSTGPLDDSTCNSHSNLYLFSIFQEELQLTQQDREAIIAMMA